MVNIENIIETIQNIIMTNGPTFIYAVITLIIGFWLIKLLTKATIKGLEIRKIDKSLKHFFSSALNISLKVLLILSVAGMFGFQTTSFVAILAAAGFAIGMALQGSLGNFAGGVLILILRPYKIGDYIDAQGHSGTVNSIELFNTRLKTPDNKIIIIPNGPMSNGNIVNYSKEKTRRVDMVFGCGYEDDIKKVKKVLEKLVSQDKRILKEPLSTVNVKELADSSVNFNVRVWVNSPDYWTVYSDMQENVKLTFDKEKISIPYPQIDIHTKK